MDLTCPYCQSPVPEDVSDCPSCGKTLIRICKCGAQVSLAVSVCPACGRSHKLRKSRGRSRFRIRPRIVVLVLVLLLAGAAITLIVLKRPSQGERLDAMMNQARDAIRAEDFRAARLLLEDILAAEPGEPRALFLLGVSRYKLGEEDEGVALVLDALRRRPSLPGARPFLVRHCWLTRRYREALEYAEGTKDPSVALLKARLLLRLGRLEDASTAYGHAISLGESGFDVMFEALAVHRQLAASGFRGSAVHRDRVHSLLLEILATAKKRLETKPGDAAARLALARAMDEAAIDEPEEIEEAWKKALDANPGNALGIALYADFLSRQGRRDEARTLFLSSLDAAQDPALYVSCQAFLLRGGEEEEAIRILGEAAERWPERADLHGTLVRTLAATGREEEARREIARALDAHVGDADLLELSGDLSAVAGDKPGAEKLYREALEARPGDMRILKKRIKLYFADLIAAQLSEEEPTPDQERVASLLQDLRELNPWDREALRWSADLARVRGRQDLALNLLDQLLSIHPDDLIARAMRGTLLMSKGDLGAAASEMRRVVDSKESTLADFLLFARAALPFGRYAEVVNACEKGLERWPDNVTLYVALGRALHSLEKGRQFVDRVEKAPDSVRNSIEVRRLLAWCLVQAGDHDRAQRVFAAVLAEQPAARGEYARLLYAMGRKEAAEGFLRDTLEENPDSPSAQIHLAEFLAGQGDRENARKLYERAVEEEPGNVRLHLRLGEFLLAAPEGEEFEPRLRELIANLEATPWGVPEALYLDGCLRLRKGEAEAARDRLARYVRLRPDRFEGRLQYATALVTLDDLEGGARELRQALTLRPDSVEAKRRLANLLFLRGAQSMRDGGEEAAAGSFEELLGVMGESRAARVLLAATYLSLGVPRLTRAQCEAVLAEDPDDGAANMLLGIAHAVDGEPEPAVACLAKAVKAFPGNPKPRFFRGLAYLDLGRPDAAIADLDRAAELGMRGLRLDYGRAHALAMAGRPDQALEVAKRAVASHPDEALPRRLLGEIHLRRGEKEAAARAMVEAYEVDGKDLAALEAAADLYIVMGKLTEAGALLDRVSDPGPRLIRVRADLFRALGRVAQAEKLYRQAADGDPRAHVGLATIAEESGDYAAARKEYEAAIDAGLGTPWIRFHHGTTLSLTGRPDEARREYEAVLEELPDHYLTLNNLALLLAESGKEMDRAATLARKARKLVPDNPDVADTLGWVLHLAGKDAEAVPLLEEGVRGRPDAPEYRYHLGMALAEAGRADQARDHLAQAVKDAPDAEWTREALQALRKLR